MGGGGLAPTPVEGNQSRSLHQQEKSASFANADARSGFSP